MEWKEKRASELYISSSGLSKSADQFGFGYPFLSYKDIFNNYYAPDKLLTLVNSSEIERKKCSVKRGDVFLTRTSETTDELGMSCVALKDYPEATFNGFSKRLRPITEEIIPEYAAYYFRSSFFRNQCKSLASLITRASLNDGMICRLKIRYPQNRSVQEKIGSVLLSYDKLIENNNKRIRLLEQMAENLYKEWFVRFRFPGHEKAEFENGLPKGWKIIKLGEFITFERGVGYGSKDIADGENVLLSMNNIRPYGGFIRDYSRPYSGKYKEFQKVKKGDLIMSITDMTQDRRIIGYTGIVPPGKDNRIICTHLMKLSSQECHSYFLDGLFNYSNLSRVIAERATGANVLGLTADILKGVKTLLPPKQLQSLYVSKVIPIIEECFSLQDANDNLSRQRDLLLPRLMSGKLEVKV